MSERLIEAGHTLDDWQLNAVSAQCSWQMPRPRLDQCFDGRASSGSAAATSVWGGRPDDYAALVTDWRERTS